MSPYQNLISLIKDTLNQSTSDDLLEHDIPPLSHDTMTRLLDLLYACLVPCSLEDESIMETHKDMISEKKVAISPFHQFTQSTKSPVIPYESETPAKQIVSLKETPQSLTRTAKFLLEKLEASEKKRQEGKSLQISKKASDPTMPKDIMSHCTNLQKLPVYSFETCAHSIQSSLSSHQTMTSVSLPTYSFE